jgi:hypothetical protein
MESGQVTSRRIPAGTGGARSERLPTLKEATECLSESVRNVPEQIARPEAEISAQRGKLCRPEQKAL